MSKSSSRAIDEKGEYPVSDSFYSEKTVIIAKSGYGKSYAARVLVEESGDVPMLIIDPQDAYLNLPGFEYITPHQIKSASALGTLIARTGKRIVLSIKGIEEDEQNDLLAALLRSYKRSIRRGIQTIIIDEIHKFAPESTTTSAKGIIRSFAQENRSDGLGFIAVTQRPARMDKTILSQADHLFIGRLTSRADVQAVEGYLSRDDDEKRLSTLPKGCFHIVDDGIATVQVRRCRTQHSGGSPQTILGQDIQTYEQYRRKAVSRTQPQEGNNMDVLDKATDAVKDVIPSKSSIIALTGMGLAISTGAAASFMLGKVVASKVKSPLPVISTQTMVGGINTLALFWGYRMTANKGGAAMKFASESLKYGAAGAAAYTAGALAFDVLNAMKVPVPAVVSNIIAIGTRASPVVAEGDALEPELKV